MKLLKEALDNLGPKSTAAVIDTAHQDRLF